MPNKHYQMWTKLEDETLLQMIRDGYDYISISEELERTEAACRSRSTKLNSEQKSSLTRAEIIKELEPGLNAMFSPKPKPTLFQRIKRMLGICT